MFRVCSGSYVHDVLPRAGTAPLKGQTNRSATQRVQLASDSEQQREIKPPLPGVFYHPISRAASWEKTGSTLAQISA